MIQNTDQRVCVCVCFYVKKRLSATPTNTVSVPGACDLSTLIRTDVEVEIISIFTHAFGNLGNKITVGEDYGSGLVSQ